MYPPAHISGIGRRLHYVPNATYSETAGERTNPTEAREVVKLIELHVRENPEKSLGVVTMNIPQMELIDEYLQLLTTDSLRAFCADESKFFLRNLETVQGDEMDRIILSLTYGKNPAGQFSAVVLGPLTKSGGERRLNVAITRSRSGMTVVSSLKAADLEGAGQGARALSVSRHCLPTWKILSKPETTASEASGSSGERMASRMWSIAIPRSRSRWSSFLRTKDTRSNVSMAQAGSGWTSLSRSEEKTCSRSSAMEPATTVPWWPARATARGSVFWRSWGGVFTGSGARTGGFLSSRRSRPLLMPSMRRVRRHSRGLRPAIRVTRRSGRPPPLEALQGMQTVISRMLRSPFRCCRWTRLDANQLAASTPWLLTTAVEPRLWPMATGSRDSFRPF
jgi:AAA domain